MSAVTTGPFAIPAPPTGAGGPGINLALPQQSPQKAVILTNLSPYACKVNIAGEQFWLAPWMENAYMLDANRQSVSVAPQGGSSPSSASGALLATWYAPGDTVPGGVWPMSLTADALAFSIAQTAPFGGGTDALFVVSATHASGGSVPLVLPGTDIPNGASVRLWNWSVNGVDTGPDTWPHTGGCVLSALVNNTPSYQQVDSMGFGDMGGSSRLSGMEVAPTAGGSQLFIFGNFTDEQLAVSLLLSIA